MPKYYEIKINSLNLLTMEQQQQRVIEICMEEYAELRQLPVSGSLQDIKEIIDFLQWAFRKIDKGDTPEETVRMLLMHREQIDNIKFDSNNS